MRRVTQADVARIAGVSQATVSLVLNSAPDAKLRVGEETKQRVLGAIERTGYTANGTAALIDDRLTCPMDLVPVRVANSRRGCW